MLSELTEWHLVNEHKEERLLRSVHARADAALARLYLIRERLELLEKRVAELHKAQQSEKDLSA